MSFIHSCFLVLLKCILDIYLVKWLVATRPSLLMAIWTLLMSITFQPQPQLDSPRVCVCVCTVNITVAEWDVRFMSIYTRKSVQKCLALAACAGGCYHANLTIVSPISVDLHYYSLWYVWLMTVPLVGPLIKSNLIEKKDNCACMNTILIPIIPNLFVWCVGITPIHTHRHTHVCLCVLYWLSFILLSFVHPNPNPNPNPKLLSYLASKAKPSP